ncbi:MAG: peptidase [Woeseiaceae bacterium]|nr:peptidase [Woeseiaceae bacterium]NIP21691.1 peptidase [Woeseiaceae bacterium]NIS90777.1 peptidase [Woeseiaceae bacterium]
MVAACSGGSGGGGLGQGGNNNNNNGWQQGVFLDWSTFYQRCTTTLDQNNFLRSYSNDTYLWYDEIVDRDPGLYNDPLVYFDLLKTNALSPSGQPKDKFHFTYDTDEWEQLTQSGTQAGYGIQWALLSNTPPRDLRIAYTEPDSPATNLPQPLARGARILEIDGVDINDNTQAGVDVLNAGIYPNDGEQHTFTVQDAGATGTRTVTMTAAVITSAPVQNTQVISTPTGQVGYMTFNDHIATAEQALIDAVDQLNAHDNGAGIDDLVLDLRYNGGGYSDIANELAYMIAGPVPTAGMTFSESQFNDKHPVTDPVTGAPLEPTPFYTTAIGAPFNGTAGQPLPALNLPRVFVLTGFGTASASELIINGLRGVGVEVIQIGATTRGKPYGFYPTDNCGTTYFTIQLRAVNALGFGDYTDGFSPENTTGIMGVSVPGCSVADDFTKQLGDVTEDRLAAALQYRDTQTCPTASGVALGEPGEAGLTVDEREPIVPKSPWHSNAIYRDQ